MSEPVLACHVCNVEGTNHCGHRNCPLPRLAPGSDPQSADERAVFPETEDIVRAGITFRGDHRLATQVAALIMDNLKAKGWRGPIRS